MSNEYICSECGLAIVAADDGVLYCPRCHTLSHCVYAHDDAHTIYRKHNRAFLKVKRLDDSLPLPEYATPGASAIDLRASLRGLDVEPKEAVVPPGETVLIPTGVAFDIPMGFVMLLFLRSSLAKKGLAQINAVNIIDQDYRGEVFVLIRNMGSCEDVYIEQGERIAQAMLVPIPRLIVSEVDELSVTQRGEGAFGSTGRH